MADLRVTYCVVWTVSSFLGSTPSFRRDSWDALAKTGITLSAEEQTVKTSSVQESRGTCSITIIVRTSST